VLLEKASFFWGFAALGGGLICRRLTNHKILIVESGQVQITWVYFGGLWWLAKLNRKICLLLLNLDFSLYVLASLFKLLELLSVVVYELVYMPLFHFEIF